MRLFNKGLLAMLALLSISASAVAADYVSTDKRDILYSQASTKSHKVAIVEAGTPLELIVNQGAWIKVRYREGQLLFIKANAISDKRYVIVIAEAAEIYNAPQISAPVVFKADKDVSLQLLGPASIPGWYQVRHRDGKSGFVRRSTIWGV